MKAVMPDVLPQWLEDRRRKGLDRWDEMWEGVLHMPPSSSRVHQDFQDELISWIREHWARPFGNRVHREVNLCPIGGWPDDYRIPDVMLLTPDRFHIDHNTYFEGPPLVVVEIHSPGDEAYEKLDFYAALGAPEAWLIHRETRKPELYVLRNGSYEELAASADGWLVSAATGIRMKSRRPKKLLIQFRDDDASVAVLPDLQG